ncbi:PREDICTED: LOW QUALITY PROTEIN: protein GREB1 [Condylura cristata]|uniref:LOW QUALITY PROTEIN: protein GREB1 n=1 Tax=Condylura cristata TaxID=143302 RepID=UPI000643C3CE|nr:PREDICTED: LOW QUALITY PROTEIN: protein GREB1 [Condylura cristata]
MGNSYAGQLKTTRFEEVLHSSIEASLRSSSLVPRPVFSQLYLEAERQLSALEGGSRGDNEEEEEEADGALEPHGPANPYQMHPPPEGCCTADGFCQAGKDLRLASISSEPLEVPAGFLLVGAKSPSLPDHLLVCAVDQRFLPDDNGHNALLGFSGNCVGCGKKGFCYFTEFSNHINLKLTTQPKKQKHLKCYLVRNAQGALTQGPLICWKGSEFRSRQASASTCPSALLPPLESPAPLAAFPGEPALANPGVPAPASRPGPACDHPALPAALAPAVFNGRDSPKHQQLARNSLSAAPRPAALGSAVRGGLPGWGHGNFPYLCGNLGDVVVSPLLHTCYQNSQAVARAYEQHGASALQPISEETQLLLTVYYLVQLAADQVPLMEDLEQIFLRSWREAHLAETRQDRQLRGPPAEGACFPGKYQARILSESLLTPAEYQKEVNYELVTGKVDSLGAFFSTLCPGYSPEPLGLRPFQLAVAQKLLSHVCSIADSSTQNLDLGSFEKVDFLICTPPSEVTYQQTLFRVWQSGVLLELGLEKEHLTKQRVGRYVLKLDAEAQTRFKSFLQNSFQNPHTLFVLIHDHAHWDLVSSAVHDLYSQSDPCAGLVDRLLNRREVKEAPNIVTLHVTSFPYALQTQHTLISPYNEIHWPAACSSGVDLYPENKKYFGLSEFIESTLSGHSLPLLRYDSSFEAMVTALGKRFPRLHSAVIRTFVLVQHYAAAMMAVSGLSQMKNYTSVETLEITQNLINSPKQCPCGHGLMVLLRVPCPPLAAVAYERLAHVRARLALEEHFDIILGNPSSGITVGKHFVKQLKMWQKIEDAEWRPQTYLELEGLPCILIFSGLDPHGESLPRSLRYCDLRLINSCLVRTALEQELGLASYFVSGQAPLDKGPRNEALESDADKLSSTDNEDEEPGVEGSASEKRSPAQRERPRSRDSASSSLSSKASSSALCGEPSAQPGGPPAGEQAGSPAPCGPSEEGWAAGERPRARASRGAPSVLSRHSPGLAPHVRIPASLRGLGSELRAWRLRQGAVPETGAYLQFLSILSRMLIRLTEVDVYDEEEINSNLRGEADWHYLQPSDPWPDVELLKKMPFDYILHDPKYEDASLICSQHQNVRSKDRAKARKPEDLCVRRRTARMRLTQYAAHNTYHHCEQCHQYMGFHPRHQLYESSLHAFAFSYSMLGEEIQLHFIIPKSKEHHFVFSQPGGQLESMRLPLVTDKSHEHIKSPTFTPTTGRHEHGLFNLYHAMDGASHLHVLVVKEYEMAIYKKYWPNHIMLVLPSIFNSAGVGRPAGPVWEGTRAQEAQLGIPVQRLAELAKLLSRVGKRRIASARPAARRLGSSGAAPAQSGPRLRGGKGAGCGDGRTGQIWALLRATGRSGSLISSSEEPRHDAVCWVAAGASPSAGPWPGVGQCCPAHVAGLVGSQCPGWPPSPVPTSGRRCAPSREFSWSERNVSLKHIMQHIEAAPNITHYALIGLRKWSSKTGSREVREPFSRCHVHDFVVLNVDLTQNVQYNQNRRLSRPRAAWRRLGRLCQAGSGCPWACGPRCGPAPGSWCCPAAAEPRLRLKATDFTREVTCFCPRLQLAGQLVPAGAQAAAGCGRLPARGRRPLLSAPLFQISVCYVSSRPHSLNISCADFLFSGLLLYLCDSFVGASFLKKFHFLKGATLCVICQDRNSLRQTVVRLELEDEWQFRLRDEFQTANAKEDRPLFFLTGRHI